MEYRPGGVDDADVTGLACQFDLRLDLIEDGVVIERLCFALPDRAAHMVQRIAAFLRDVIAIVTAEQRGAARMIQQAIDGWKFAQQCRGLIGHEETKICTARGQIQLGTEPVLNDRQFRPPPAEVGRSLTYPKVRKYIKSSDAELDQRVATLALIAQLVSGKIAH